MKKGKNLTLDKEFPYSNKDEFLKNFDEYSYSLVKSKVVVKKSKFATFAKKVSAAAVSFATLLGLGTGGVKFSEPTIEKAVRSYLAVSADKALSSDMLKKIETVELFGEDIYIINGVEGKLTATTTNSKKTFKYAGNEYRYGDISNLSDLARLSGLKSFVLHYNEGAVGEQIKKSSE